MFRNLIVLALCLNLNSLKAANVSLPAYYAAMPGPKNAGEELDYTLISLNSERHLVKNQEALDFVRGDLIKIEGAALKGKGIPKILNLVGFVQQGKRHSADDKGAIIDTANKLVDKTWATDPSGTHFVVVAYGQNVRNGYVLLRRIDPLLEYAEVEINGEKRLLRDREIAELKRSDTFRVAGVKTNLSAAKQKAVMVDIVETNELEEDKAENLKEVALEFSYAAYLFARITLKITD